MAPAAERDVEVMEVDLLDFRLTLLSALDDVVDKDVGIAPLAGATDDG
jgi:hypothetical protein